MLNGNPAPTTATDSFTETILSEFTARSALRANGKDQKEEQKKDYYLLGRLLSAFDNPSLVDDGGNEEGIHLSDVAVLSLADEKDNHSVSCPTVYSFTLQNTILSFRTSILLQLLN